MWINVACLTFLACLLLRLSSYTSLNFISNMLILCLACWLPSHALSVERTVVVHGLIEFMFQRKGTHIEHMLLSTNKLSICGKSAVVVSILQSLLHFSQVLGKKCSLVVCHCKLILIELTGDLILADTAGNAYIDITWQKQRCLKQLAKSNVADAKAKVYALVICRTKEWGPTSNSKNNKKHNGETTSSTHQNKLKNLAQMI